jgi:lipoprotein
MKKITALLLTALTAAVLLCGCAGGTAVQLSYAESFVLSAFNDINGASFGAQAGGCTLSTATYAYTDGETLARCAPKTATQRELGFYSDIYCCVRLWVIRDGETVMYERFFALSGYDLTQELSREELRAALDGLTAHLEFERCDLSRLSRFLPIAPLA